MVKSWVKAVMFLGLVCVGMGGEPSAPQFQDGDRVCFVGDSITCLGRYTAYVQLFYYTRYPERQILYFNCGRSGGTAGQCLERLSWDVLTNRPTVALVMFGMNDMGGLYGDAAKAPETVEKAIAGKMSGVKVNYNKLLDQLTAAGARLILAGPSIYDDTAKLKTSVQRSNLAMTRWTEEIGRIAGERKCGFADLVAVMNPVNARMQAANSEATLIGGDRVHPGNAGSVVMAYAILKAQQVEPYVSRIALDGVAGKPGELCNCSIEKVERNEKNLSFTCFEKALPFVLPKNATEALNLIPLTDELNREMFTVANLPEGRYELRIDDAVAGTNTSVELAAGVNLAANSQTPQYRQALKLAGLTDEMCGIEYFNFRTKALIREMVVKKNIDPEDGAAVKQFLSASIENKPENKFTYNDYQARLYLKDILPRWDERVRRHAELLKQVEEMRKPKPHQFVLNKVEGM